MLTPEQEKWNKVYRETIAENLPWFGIDIPDEIIGFLSNLNKKELILITGCGAGDFAKKMSESGFSNLLATDVSSVAIEKAKERFPDLNFRNISTEDICNDESIKNVNVIDWLNLHQISSPEGYLNSLGKISKNLYIVWIHDSDDSKSAKSYVHEGNIYYHSPILVKNILEKNGLSLKQETRSSFKNNSNVKESHIHNAIGQIYDRK